jgi:(p)ppGpp synthase/HD superfamily hydrolase
MLQRDVFQASRGQHGDPDQATKLGWMKAGLPIGPELIGSPELKESLNKLGIGDMWKEIEPAYRFAQSSHQTQKRDDGTPYYHHCARTARNLMEHFQVKDPDVIKAALLHDTLEDCKLKPDSIKARFGPRVAELVQAMTKPDCAPGESYDQRNERYLRDQIVNGPPGAVEIKLADRMDNIDDLHLVPSRSMVARYIEDTQHHYLPLARERYPAVGERMTQTLAGVQRWMQSQ